MAGLRFKTDKQRQMIFSWDGNGPGTIDYFCGMDSYGDFYTDSYNAYDFNEDDQPKLVTSKDLFKEFCRNVVREGSFIIADCQDGPADRWLLSIVPKRAFVLVVGTQGWTITPHLSKYYRNSNSGNQVRHCTVVMERVK